MNVYLTLATRYGLNILGLLGVSVALYLGRPIFIPLTISILLAAMFHPLAQWFHTRLRLPWFLACLGVIFFLVFIHFAIMLAVVASVPQIINRLPDSEEKWERKYEEFANRVKETSPFPTENALPLKAGNSPFYRSVKNLFSPENVGSYLQTFAYYAFANIGQVVLVLFVILFLLLEGELLAKKVRALFGPSEESSRRVAKALGQMGEAIRTYLFWRTMINLLLGLLVGLVYNLANLEQWYLWAVLTVVLNYVPYIGTIAAGVGPVAEALLGGNAELALGIIIGYALIVTFEGYWIVPRVMGKTMDLNATTVMVSCLYWNLEWGVAGLFLAMPIMAAFKAILMNVDGYQPWGELLSSVDTTPAPPPSDISPRPVEFVKPINQNGDVDATIIMEVEPAGSDAAAPSLRTP